MDDVDRRILAFAGAHRFVLDEQVGRFVGLARPVADSRVDALEAAGLVRSERVLARCARTVRITPSGLNAIDSRLTAPGFELAGFRHEVGVVWLWVAAWQGAFGEMQRVLSRREMAGLDTAARRLVELDRPARFAVDFRGADGERVGPSFPDVMLVSASGRVAAFVELGGRAPAELEGLIRSYCAAADVGAMLFLVDGGRALQFVATTAERLGVRDRVRVQRVVMERAASRGKDLVAMPPSS